MGRFNFIVQHPKPQKLTCWRNRSAQLTLVLRLSAGLGIMLALSGCLEPTAKVTEPAEAQSLADAMTYVRAKNGLCFGVSTTTRIDTGGKLSYTNQAVNVPCAAVGL